MAILTTLCYIRDTKKDQFLMLYRNAKKNDLNEGKWVGTGGKFQPGESPDECMLREVKEETGLTLTEYAFKGVITFLSDKWEDEYMFLYEGTGYEGEMAEYCREGSFSWIDADKLLSLPTWAGDHLFLTQLVEGKERINWKVVYEGDRLVYAEEYH